MSDLIRPHFLSLIRYTSSYSLLCPKCAWVELGRLWRKVWKTSFPTLQVGRIAMVGLRRRDSFPIWRNLRVGILRTGVWTGLRLVKVNVNLNWGKWRLVWRVPVIGLAAACGESSFILAASRHLYWTDGIASIPGMRNGMLIGCSLYFRITCRFIFLIVMFFNIILEVLIWCSILYHVHNFSNLWPWRWIKGQIEVSFNLVRYGRRRRRGDIGRFLGLTTQRSRHFDLIRVRLLRSPLSGFKIHFFEGFPLGHLGTRGNSGSYIGKTWSFKARIVTFDQVTKILMA